LDVAREQTQLLLVLLIDLLAVDEAHKNKELN
jgi:hypothetical protein